MRPDGGQERRRVQRTKLVTFCPTIFSYEGSEHCALMVDVSEKGARFRLETHDDNISLLPNSVLKYGVKTPYGSSECSGRTVWAKKIEDALTWGIEFTELSSDEKDALRCLIDSPF